MSISAPSSPHHPAFVGQIPHATCTVTLVDRLVHRSEILEIDGDSYRLKEAKGLQLQRSSSRRTKKPKP